MIILLYNFQPLPCVQQRGEDGCPMRVLTVAHTFNLREFGGSVSEHNPSIITNDAQNLLDCLKNTTGSISFVENISPFLMLNVSSASNGFNRFGVDWFCNDSQPNGLELVFNAGSSIFISSNAFL